MANKSNTYLICQDDGTVTDWIYDLDESRKLEARDRRKHTVITAGIPTLVTAGALALRGVSPISRTGLIFMSISVGAYFVMRVTQNVIESLVAWVIIFILILLSIPRFT